MLLFSESTGCHASLAVQDLIQNTVRRLVRDTIEHCALIAEDFVPNEDVEDTLTGLEVGDEIAKELRSIAEERRLSEYTTRQN